MTRTLNRARPLARRPTGEQRWYSVSKAAQRGGEGPSFAEVYIYEEIDPWYGIGAQQLVDELRDLDVDEIDLHLNSPGGLVFDGIAIYQAFVDHRAQVTVYVDALAASIASVIAMAGDRIVMGRMAQMMIHDCWGLCVGDANDMRQMADELDRISDTIAIAYTDQAGGTVKQWRKAMLAETWYSAEEAVAAGLADEVAAKTGPDDDAPMSLRRWNLADRGFRYPGREAAPAPQASDAGAAPPDTPPVDPDPPEVPPEDEAAIADEVVDEIDAGADDVTFDLSDADVAEITAGFARLKTDNEVPWDPETVTAAWAHDPAPASTPIETAPNQDPESVDLDDFATALMEALK